MRKLTREGALENLELTQVGDIDINNQRLSTAYHLRVEKQTTEEEEKERDTAVKSVAILLPKKPTTIQETLSLFKQIFFEKNAAKKYEPLYSAQATGILNAKLMHNSFYSFAAEALGECKDNSKYRTWQTIYCALINCNVSENSTAFYTYFASISNSPTTTRLNHTSWWQPTWDVFYQFIYKKIHWANLTAEEGVTCLEFLHSKDGEKLYEVFELIDSEIQKNSPAEESNTLREELITLRGELIHKIADTFNPPKVKNEIPESEKTNGEKRLSKDNLMNELLSIVESKIQEKRNIVENEIKERSEILDFLRKIAGILLVICGVGIPLCCPPFRSYFFESRPAEASLVSLELLNNISRSLQPQR